MRRFRFTQKTLEDLRTDLPREYVYDEQIRLLAVMVTRAGSKSFYVLKTREGKKKFVRIGSVAEVPIPRARTLAAEILLKVATGEEVGAPKARAARAGAFTLEVAYLEYRRYLEQHRKPNTIYQFNRQWEKFLKPWAGDRPMRSIRRHEVVNLHQQIGEQNGHHQANRVIAFLRAIINRAIREHELALANPANAIMFYRENQRSRRLMREEVPAFFRSVDDEPNVDIRDFILVSLFTGARKSNVLSMRWCDISLDRGVWIVPASDSKNSKELDVLLSKPVLDILQTRLQHVRGEFVFPGRVGRTNQHMMDPKMGWYRICERAGMTDLHMHDLRRSLASFQIDAGTPLEVIQKTLGHESKTTTEIYARMALETVRASVERAAEDILRAKKG
ncbi:MAG: site-specific integrase [Candidatus Delongbacteria bacterium]